MQEKQVWKITLVDGEWLSVNQDGLTMEEYQAARLDQSRIEAEDAGRVAIAQIGGMWGLGMIAVTLSGIGLPAIAVGGVIGGIFASSKLLNRD